MVDPYEAFIMMSDTNRERPFNRKRLTLNLESNFQHWRSYVLSHPIARWQRNRPEFTGDSVDANELGPGFLVAQIKNKFNPVSPSPRLWESDVDMSQYGGDPSEYVSKRDGFVRYRDHPRSRMGIRPRPRITRNVGTSRRRYLQKCLYSETRKELEVNLREALRRIGARWKPVS